MLHFNIMITFYIDFLIMNIQLFSNAECRLHFKQILEWGLLRPSQNAPNMLEANLEKMFIGRSTCIYVSICIHAKKNIFISNNFVVIDTENTYVLKNNIWRHWCVSGICQNTEGEFLVWYKLYHFTKWNTAAVMVLPVSIPTWASTNSRRGRLQLFCTGSVSVYLSEQLNPSRRLYAGTVWLINECLFWRAVS